MYTNNLIYFFKTPLFDNSFPFQKNSNFNFTFVKWLKNHLGQIDLQWKNIF
jgi:hypothetical protein